MLNIRMLFPLSRSWCWGRGRARNLPAACTVRSKKNKKRQSETEYKDMNFLDSVVDLHHVDADPDSTYHHNADPDPTFHPDADPDPEPSFQIKAQTLEKVLIFHTFWLVICKLMWIRIPLITLIRMRIRILIFIWFGSGFLFDADADPGYQNDTDPSGSESTILFTTRILIFLKSGQVF
jgi:hypothetical protein